jgi:hypothetical protein
VSVELSIPAALPPNNQLHLSQSRSGYYMKLENIRNESSLFVNSVECDQNIIIIVFINCNWVVTRCQWLFYMYTNMKKSN